MAKAFNNSNKKGPMFFSFASVWEAPATFVDEKHRALGSTNNSKLHSSRNKLKHDQKSHNASAEKLAGHNASGGTNNTKTESYPWPLNYIFESDFATGVAAMAGSFGKVLDTAFTSAGKIRMTQVLATAFCFFGVCFVYKTSGAMDHYQLVSSWWVLVETVIRDVVQNVRGELVTQVVTGFSGLASGFAETIISTFSQ